MSTEVQTVNSGNARIGEAVLVAVWGPSCSGTRSGTVTGCDAEAGTVTVRVRHYAGNYSDTIPDAPRFELDTRIYRIGEV